MKPLTTQQNKPMCFSFGDAESVLNNQLYDYLGVFLHSNYEYYEPPVSLIGLAKMLRANAHHGTIPYFKRNMLLKYFVPDSILSRSDLSQAALDFIVFGNCYFQRITNRVGTTLRLKHIPAINMRRGKNEQFFYLKSGADKPVLFNPDEVIHIKEYDVSQVIYGIPDYLGGMQSLLLNESATLFRRKYYDNGAHMGYIFYTNDANLGEADEKLIREKITQSKGVGNFRSMFLNIPNGHPDGVKIIPVGDIATKDEFERIKNISRNDILSAHRIQPALAGIMPEQNNGFGDIEKISRVYFDNETLPLQSTFLQINEFLPSRLKVCFNNPELLTGI